MSIFNKLLASEEKEEDGTLAGDKQTQQQSNQSNFLFCFNIKKYFQVEEDQLGQRVKSAVILRPAFRQVVRDQPDLYGPFWISTTLIVIIIASSSLISFFNTKENERIKYNFDQIPVAAALIYGICFISPYVIAIMVKIFKGSVSVVHLICIYGYSLTIFIPITALCFLQSSIFQTVVLALGFCSSTTFLIRGVLSMDRSMGERERIVIGVFIMGVQLIMVLMYKFYFFDLL